MTDQASRAKLQALLQRALAALRSGDAAQVSDAQAACREVLQIVPEQPDALQLLGTLARRTGDATAAEHWFVRSLSVAPRQPQVWNKLGNLHAEQRRLTQALDCFDRALAIDPGHIEAHYNRARALLARGDLSHAASAADGVIAAMGSDVDRHPLAPAALQLQAQIHADRGEAQLALDTLSHALRLAPTRAALHHNRGAVLARQGQDAAALQALDQALALGLDEADAHYNRGNALQGLGRLDDAEAAYRSALRRDPKHRLALTDLARLRWRMGDVAFDADLRDASARHPRDAMPALVLGQLFWRDGRIDQAASAFEEAMSREPGIESHDGLGRCLVRQGHFGAGLEHHRQAVAIAQAAGAGRPLLTQLRVQQATSQLIAGLPRLAAQNVQDLLADLAPGEPPDQQALALLGLAWRALGDPREHELFGAARFVLPIDLPAPEGWPSIEAFCSDLAHELDRLHHDRRAPIDQTLRGGTQTVGRLLDSDASALLRPLRSILGLGIESYIARMGAWEAAGSAGHPLMVRRGGGWRFSDSWSVRLGGNGWHINHVHPHGWISAAFYVVVPPECADPQQRAGWLVFDEPDADLGLAPGTRCSSPFAVQPRVGRMVLFPSLKWHGTTPLGGSGQRTTVSFDVLPRQASTDPVAPWLFARS